jgi:S-formylglutathione hydrolase FrmB
MSEDQDSRPSVGKCRVFLDFDIVSWWVPAAIGVLAVVVALLVFFRRERRVLLVTGGVFSLVLALLAIGAGVNVHFDYFRTLGELFGQVPGEASAQQIRAQERKGVPAEGLVVSQSIPGTASGFDARDAQIYLPPAFFAKPRPQLPVLMLFHGDPGQPTDWVEGGNIEDTANAYAKANNGQGPIIVMPDINGGLASDTECVDGTRGNAETYLTKDVRDAVVSKYSAATDPTNWAIGGLSEGGYCAFMLAVRHPDLWTTFVDLSGLNVPNPDGTTAEKLLGGDKDAVAAYSPLEVIQQPNAAWSTLGGWFAVGAQDSASVIQAVQAAAAGAQQAGIQTELKIDPGNHSFYFWSAAMAAAFPWVAQRLGLP